jgi:hypothetical protein
MKTWFMLLTFLTLCTTSKAKNNTILKVYNQSTYAKVNTSYKYYYLNDTLHSYGTKKNTTLLHPTIAFNWANKRQNIHELELTHFKFDIQDEYDKWHIGLNQTKSTILSIAIRYETIFSFLKKKNTRIKPQLGVAFSPFIDYFNSIPYTSNQYGFRDVKFGLKHYAIPRCLIQMSRKWSIDINVPILIAKAQYLSKELKNPSIPVNEHKYSIFDFDMLQKEYSIRLGICYQL